jgi:hypothetical protein
VGQRQHELIARRLLAIWRGERGDGEPSIHVWELATDGAEAFAADRDVQFVDDLAFGEERWVFALVDGKAYLLRLIGVEYETDLEIVFLGRLLGGRYTERRREDRVALTFDHPRLPGPIVIETTSPSRVAQLRDVFREWAETAPPFTAI